MAVKKVGSENWIKDYPSKADLILLRNERSFFACLCACWCLCLYLNEKASDKTKKEESHS